MPTPLSIELVEERFLQQQSVIDGITLDLTNSGVLDPADADPEDDSWDDATRHYLEAYNRAFQVQAALNNAGVAIDPDYVPPPVGTRT